MSQSSSGISMEKYMRLILGILIFLVLITFLSKGCNGANDTQKYVRESASQTTGDTV